MKAQIFLSYVRPDKHRVADLYQRLSSAGYAPWMDTIDILPGELWKVRIQRAIREAHVFLACISSNSLSRRGFLQKEVRNALDVWQEKLPDDIYLIPVRLDNCKVPENLVDFHWVDLFEPEGWGHLLKSIETAVARLSTESPAALALPEEPAATNLPAVERPEPQTQLPVAQDLDHKARDLPVMTFPHELGTLLQWLSPELCRILDDDTRRFLVTLGSKLEPMVQIVPPTPIPLVIGFECLALGSLGENFGEICQRASVINPGYLRMLLALSAMKTAETLRTNAAEAGITGVRHLLFTVNLDPETLNCPRLEEFLDRYQHIWEDHFLFELSESTTSSCFRRLRELQADFKLRYCADDYNAWDPDAKRALHDRVEMSKVDYDTFRMAMDIRGTQPKAAVARLMAHKIRDKPLIAEGLEQQNYLRFLSAHWPHHTHGGLFGQGYIVKPGQPWDRWITDLQAYGLPGGHFLAAGSVHEHN